MSTEGKVVSADEAREAVRAMTKRVALLHMCYARTLVDELGVKSGTELIKKAIWAYGTLIGERIREKVGALNLATTPDNFTRGSDLSPIGFDSQKEFINGEQRSRVYGCALAEIWQEYGEQELGDLYCLVDPAKMQAYNPKWTLTHLKKVLDGEECCELAIRPMMNNTEHETD